MMSHLELIPLLPCIPAPNRAEEASEGGQAMVRGCRAMLAIPRASGRLGGSPRAMHDPIARGCAGI